MWLDPYRNEGLLDYEQNTASEQELKETGALTEVSLSLALATTNSGEYFPAADVYSARVLETFDSR